MTKHSEKTPIDRGTGDSVGETGNGPSRASDQSPRSDSTRCPECGRDASDESKPRVTRLSWRRLLPLAVLLLATLTAVALSTPATRVWLLGKWKSHSGSYNLNDGVQLFNIQPFEVTPEGLQAMADGTGPTQELRKLVQDIADSPSHILPTLDPQPEIMVCVGTHNIIHGYRRFYGRGLTLANRYESLVYTDSFDESFRDLPLTEPDHNLFSFWPSMTWSDTTDTRYSGTSTVFWVPIVICGLGWLVYVLAGRCTSWRWGRVLAVVGLLLWLGVSSQFSQTETQVSYGDKPTPLERTGVTFDAFLASRESEAALRELAAAMLAAIPETAPRDGVCYLGSRVPIEAEYEYHTIGPTFFYIGDLSRTTIYHADEQGQRLGPATWKPAPVVKLLRVEPWLTWVNGNTRYTLQLQTASLLAMATLIALANGIPRWCFAFVANRRHKRRLRLGQCCGCGYDLGEDHIDSGGSGVAS